jgi:hypothetical protein
MSGASRTMPYPAKKTSKLIEEVLSRIALGETLASLGRELKFHPTAWSQWVREDEALRIAYAEARDVGADVIADTALEIIDAEPERIVQTDADGKTTTTRLDSAGVAWAKNRAEFRLKLLAKWSPQKYGDGGSKDSDTDTTDVPEADDLAKRVVESVLAAKRDGE